MLKALLLTTPFGCANVLQSVTVRYVPLLIVNDVWAGLRMGFVIDGVNYYTTTEITGRLSVTRQTLWRWRSSGKIPYGHRFRNKQVVFTESELKEIEEYANRIEPLHIASPQLSLFSNNWRPESSEGR